MTQHANMIRYSKYWSRIFLSPETGGGDSGSSGNPGASQAGAKETEGSAEIDPYANLNLDDYDPEVAKILKAGKEQFTSLQKLKADADKARLEQEAEKRMFQSKYDQLSVQVQKLTGTSGQQQVDPKVAQLDKFIKILTSRGVAEPQAKMQAEMLLEMFGDFGAALKSEIGKDLTPFAATVVARDAEYAWHSASQQDKTGAMQIPEIQKQAWEQVQLMANQGQQVTPEIVTNLVGMAYFKHLQAGGTAVSQQQQQQQQTSQFPNIGKPLFGGGNNPQRLASIDANAPKYQLDEATDAALQTVLGTWAKGRGGVKAPGLRSK